MIDKKAFWVYNYCKLKIKEVIIMKQIVKIFISLVLALCLVCSFLSCSGSDDNKLTVAVSVVPQSAFVKAVAGDLVNVVTMVPPGNSPENYEPTPKLMAAFSEADVFFSIGVPTESAYIYPIISKNTELVDLAAAVDSIYAPVKINESRDPHAWLSPKRAEVMVSVIAEVLAEKDPENRFVYRANAEKYIAELRALDAEISEALEGVKNKSFIVYHPAFGYLAADYGLTMYALEDGGHEISASRLAEMTELAKQEGIKVVFYQAETASSGAEAFAAEIGGVAMMLDPLSENYIENMRAMANVIAEAMK